LKVPQKHEGKLSDLEFRLMC